MPIYCLSYSGAIFTTATIFRPRVTPPHRERSLPSLEGDLDSRNEPQQIDKLYVSWEQNASSCCHDPHIFPLREVLTLIQLTACQSCRNKTSQHHLPLANHSLFHVLSLLLTGTNDTSFTFLGGAFTCFLGSLCTASL